MNPSVLSFLSRAAGPKDQHTYLATSRTPLFSPHALTLVAGMLATYYPKFQFLVIVNR